MFLCVLPLGVTAQVKQPFKKARPLPSAGEFVRVIDPITENTIVRLTVISSNSILPSARNHFVSARERLLTFSSDRSGHLAPYQMDLRTGTIRQIAEATKLDARSVCLDRAEKLVRYLDGDSLFEASLARSSPRMVAEGVTSFSTGGDGSLFLITGGKLVRKDGNKVQTLAEQANESWPQPNGAGCLFSRPAGTGEREFYYAPVDGSASATLMASGPLREPYWDNDGQSILFLRDVTTVNGTLVAEIHGRAIHNGEEYLIAPTSQFAGFAPNSDASVFVGASRSRAQPNVILMLRSPHREMTLCEHRSGHPMDVSPVFSPDNRRIYFQSDHEGKAAIYSVNVELLVEPS